MTMTQGDPNSPPNEAVAVTKSDSTILTPTRFLYVGTGGDVAVRMAGPGGAVVTIPGVPSGVTLRIMVDKVMSTNTAASGFVALW